MDKSMKRKDTSMMSDSERQKMERNEARMAAMRRAMERARKEQR